MTLSKKLVVGIGVGFIVIFLLAAAAVAYTTSWGDPVSISFKKLFPAAIVSGHVVSIEDADEFVNLARVMDPTVSPSTDYNTFLDHQRSQALLGRLGIKLDSDAVSDELNFYTKGSGDSFDALLKTYFSNSQKLFKDNVVYPSVVEANLKIKYNSDFTLNKEAYSKAQDIIERLKNGEKFEELAKQYSDDKQSAQFGGDMGFFEHSQILPELEKQIAVAKTGEVHSIIVTRDGYEIVYPIEIALKNDKKMWHAKHILIQTNGFEQWLTNQTANISVTILKKY